MVRLGSHNPLNLKVPVGITIDRRLVQSNRTLKKWWKIAGSGHSMHVTMPLDLSRHFLSTSLSIPDNFYKYTRHRIHYFLGLKTSAWHKRKSHPNRLVEGNGFGLNKPIHILKTTVPYGNLTFSYHGFLACLARNCEMNQKAHVSLRSTPRSIPEKPPVRLRGPGLSLSVPQPMDNLSDLV